MLGLLIEAAVYTIIAVMISHRTYQELQHDGMVM
jgi:hypothetical protein